MDVIHTPMSQMQLSSELRNVILERNLLTTKTRMKVLSALENITIETKENKESNLRSKAVNEILTSEATYLYHLELMMKYFMGPVRQNKYISDEDYAIIFGNIETIYHVNGELLNELKHNQENIAAAFLKLAPFLKLYSVFAYDYQRGLNLLDSLQKKFPKLDEFIKKQECHPEVSTKLVSLLITPIQRIPRYCLLLKEVISHTPPSHPDFGVLQESYQQVESSARHINSLMQEQENMQKMLEIQKCFCKGNPQIIAPGRKFIKAGKLMKVSRKGRKVLPRYFILLNDMLLYCKILSSDPTSHNSLSCVCVLPLKKCEVQWVMGKAIFKVSCLTESFVLYSSCHEESESWVTALKEAIKIFQEHRQTLRKGSSSKRPLRGSEIKNLWQNSPQLNIGRKRIHPGSNEKGELFNQCDRDFNEFHQVGHRVDEPIQPSPCKIRKTKENNNKGKKTPLKDTTNLSNKPPDSLFPMRLEFSDSPHTSRPTGSTSKENSNREAKAATCFTPSQLRSRSCHRELRTENGRTNVNNEFNSEGVNERERENGNNNLWSNCFRHSTSVVDENRDRVRRNSWHNRYYRVVCSFSVNLHQSFRRGIERLSRHPNNSN